MLWIRGRGASYRARDAVRARALWQMLLSQRLMHALRLRARRERGLSVCELGGRRRKPPHGERCCDGGSESTRTLLLLRSRGSTANAAHLLRSNFESERERCCAAAEQQQLKPSRGTRP